MCNNKVILNFHRRMGQQQLWVHKFLNFVILVPLTLQGQGSERNVPGTIVL